MRNKELERVLLKVAEGDNQCITQFCDAVCDTCRREIMERLDVFFVEISNKRLMETCEIPKDAFLKCREWTVVHYIKSAVERLIIGLSNQEIVYLKNISSFMRDLGDKIVITLTVCFVELTQAEIEQLKMEYV